MTEIGEITREKNHLNEHTHTYTSKTQKLFVETHNITHYIYLKAQNRPIIMHGIVRMD